MARQIQTAEKNGGIASDCAHWLRDWRAPGVILGAILLLALGVRIAYLVEVSEYPNFRTPYLGLDAALYHDLAKRVASGDLLLGDEVYGYSPLYAYFLGGLYAVFGESPWVPRIGNIGLGLGTIWLVYLLTVTLTGSRRWALIAPLGAALYGPYLVFETSALKTSLQLFLCALSLYLILRGRASSRLSWWLRVGLALGLTHHVFEQIQLFVCSAFALLLLDPIMNGTTSSTKGRNRYTGAVARCGLLLLGLVVALSPFFLRNLAVAGETGFFRSDGSFLFFVGNHRSAWGGYAKVPGVRANPAGHIRDSHLMAERQAGRKLTSGESGAFGRSQVIRFFRTRPDQALRLMGTKFLLVFNAYEAPNNENYGLLTDRSTLLSLALRFGWILPFAMAGMVLAAARFREWMPLYFIFVSVAAGLLLIFVNWRYRIPVTIVFWTATAMFFSQIAILISRRRSFEIMGTLLIAIGFALFSRLDVVSEEQKPRQLVHANGKMER